MQRQDQPTRERILNAAERLFAEKGYKETTTREIVREAEASLSSLQAHFQGKENVYYEVRYRAIEELYQFMRPSLEEVDYMDSQGMLYGETAWNLLYELISKYAAWCFDPKNRYAITLVSRELLDGAPVQGLPEEKIEASFAAARLLFLRYVGVETGDWALLVGHIVFHQQGQHQPPKYPAGGPSFQAPPIPNPGEIPGEKLYSPHPAGLSRYPQDSAPGGISQSGQGVHH